MTADDKRTGWRRQIVTLDVLAYGPKDPSEWDWRALIKHGAADVVDSEPCRCPEDES